MSDTSIVEPTSDELALVLDAIASQPAALLGAAGLAPGEVRSTKVAEAYVIRGKNSLSCYVNFVDPRSVPRGQIYWTWIVSREAGSVRVSYFRSLVREDGRGDDTLPPLPLPSDPASR
jgi:hypothetical protein